MATQLLLLRHAQSAWNAEHRWQGRADPSLSPSGREQATQVAQAAAEAVASSSAHPLLDVVTVWSSPQRRAHETALILAEHLGIGPVRTDPRLCERDVGMFTGLTRQEINQRWPGFLGTTHHRPDVHRTAPNSRDGWNGIDPPGAEPQPLVVERALATMRAIAAAHPGQRVAVVTHGALIRIFERHSGASASGPPTNLSGRWFDVAEGRVDLGQPVDLADLLGEVTPV
jgi:probable phosphoglycerate mutase